MIKCQDHLSTRFASDRGPHLGTWMSVSGHWKWPNTLGEPSHLRKRALIQAPGCLILGISAASLASEDPLHLCSGFMNLPILLRGRIQYSRVTVRKTEAQRS